MSHSLPTDDTLLINRQAELHDKVAVALYHQPFQTLLDQGHDGWARAVRDVCTALGVGKPEPVTAQEVSFLRFGLHEAIAVISNDAGDPLPYLKALSLHASRIERAIGGGHEGT